MKTLCVISVGLALLGGSVAAVHHFSSDPRSDDNVVESKKISLDAIYFTTRQPGLNLIDHGNGDEGFADQFEELYRHAARMGASNVFLVRGKDIREAVWGTRNVFQYGWAVDRPVHGDEARPSKHVWMSAYLGVAGSGGAWVLNSAEIRKNTVRLSYTRKDVDVNDMRPYLAWIPLGNLPPANYELELFDRDMQTVSLLRRVNVAKE